MSVDDTALWWARHRAAGPQRVPPAGAHPTGMIRLVEPDASAVWLLPELPDNARPDVLDELGLPGVAVDQPNDTARVLAACLRCCWTEPSGPVWPAAPAPFDRVISVFRGITGSRDERALHAAAMGAVRRLAGAGWVLFDEDTRVVRLGPRVASWSAAELSTLRELWRSLPPPSTDGAA
ncbi:hypothetical protein [Jiangella rhizosphaerae]|uniref:Uncharacterized protein n=1 Tax=Jiangella rhizosphaerae TaxID=2293569 RepID=A0A418KSD0_9ACTN|nr:hypothetical protein [Jiangella rhizosphaerae]RIQ27356.1 hypothetical protein DY240_09495 [Jiangella rhizosphaerae]